MVRSSLELNTMNQSIKDDLELIMDGALDSVLSPKDLKWTKESSFLFNHTWREGDKIIFEYSDIRIVTTVSSMVGIDFYRDIYGMMNGESFQRCFKEFKRNWSLQRILE